MTLNLTPGKTVYGEKVVKVEGAEGAKIEYRVWNPFRSKLAATVLGGAANIWIAPGSKVLYLGAASGTSVSHVSDIVGPVRTCDALSRPRAAGFLPRRFHPLAPPPALPS